MSNLLKQLIREFGWATPIMVIGSPIWVPSYFIVSGFVKTIEFIEKHVGYWAYEGKCSKCNKNKDKKDWLTYCKLNCYK